MSFEPGDVILVPFPLTNQSGSKRRPAVVVRSETFHDESADLVIMAVTTQSRATSSLQVAISKWQDAGLLRPSVVKPVFATIERSLVVKKIGKLQHADLQALRESLRRAFAG